MNRNRSKFKVKALIYFSVVVVLAFILSVYFLFRDSKELSALEEELELTSNNFQITLCKKQVDNDFIVDFSKRFQSKVAGSNPVKFFDLSIQVNNSISRFYIGTDSKKENLYWLYSYKEPNIKIPLAYIKTNYFSNVIEGCDEVTGAWVNKYIPR